MNKEKLIQIGSEEEAARRIGDFVGKLSKEMRELLDKQSTELLELKTTLIVEMEEIGASTDCLDSIILEKLMDNCPGAGAVPFNWDLALAGLVTLLEGRPVLLESIKTEIRKRTGK